MKEYKRLTKPNRHFDTNDGEHDIILELDEHRYEYPQWDYDDICEKLNRLVELENKIENGTLMEIDKPFVKPTKFGKYLLCKATVFLLEVFNTKAEAEEKLEELTKNEE